jgi:hypothetical protein
MRAQIRGYAFGLILAAIGLLVIALRWGPVTHAATSDFAVHFVPAGKQVLNGHLQYSLPRHYSATNVGIYRYPPFAAVLYALVAWLPYRAAAITWWAFGLLLVTGTAVLMAARSTQHGASRPLAAGVLLLLFVMFAPVASSMSQELDIWIAALIGAAYVLSASSRRLHVLTAGVLLGIAVSLKVYPLLTLAVILTLRRSEARMLLVGAACSIVTCLVIPLAILGTGPTREYFLHVVTSQGSPVLSAFPYAFGFLNIADRALAATPWSTGSAGLDPSSIKAIFAVFVVCILAFTIWRAARAGSTRNHVWAAALLVTAACSPFLETDHLAGLALVPAILAGSGKRRMGLLVPVLTGCAVCGIAWALLNPYPVGWNLTLDLLRGGSAIVAAAVGVWVYRREGAGAGLFSGAFVLLATPAFLGFSGAPWRVPLSQIHVALGSMEYVLVIVLLLLLPQAVEGSRRRQPDERIREPCGLDLVTSR